jgi:putative transposase
LFETDIKYGYIAGEDRFFFIQSVLDVYDRSVIAYHIGLSCEAKDASRTVQQALFKRQLFGTEARPVLRSDNGRLRLITLAKHVTLSVLCMNVFHCEH